MGMFISTQTIIGSWKHLHEYYLESCTYLQTNKHTRTQIIMHVLQCVAGVFKVISKVMFLCKQSFICVFLSVSTFADYILQLFCFHFSDEYSHDHVSFIWLTLQLCWWLVNTQKKLFLNFITWFKLLWQFNMNKQYLSYFQNVFIII